MSPVHLRNLGFQRNEPEDREGLSRIRRPGKGRHRHSGGWQDTEGNNTYPDIHFPIQQEPQTRGLEKHGSSSSAPPTPKRFISMEHAQQEVQPRIPLGRTWSKRTADPDRAYANSFRLTRRRPNQLSSGFTPFKNQQISGQQSPFFTLPQSFQEKTRIQGQNQDHLQPEKQFEELDASHERMKILTASMDKIVKNLQEGHAQLSKASEETNKRLNLVFEEQLHSKRERDCLDQDINKLLNAYHNMKPQPQGYVMDNPYHQDDIKPDAMLMNKARSPSQHQDGDNISYSEKEALKQLPEALSCPKFSGTGEYDHIELIGYIDGLFIDLPSI
ncbi:hypothetical protein O181_068423 [Austropuccinia psidii MF-1]|uniref:Uncharacterized protein n=1 Tax=Austropuccinia psidii MF-1 TaxID=1389203 RepID=A0A9Q3EV85_9BASI|nr:hypothetical protein [Austropuccinia psidii MF-1]